ncbi:BrnA antitoxin family protein, partial [Escherichia coli]|nr:BrnA antitoxin family protein [Escherichia coli]
MREKTRTITVRLPVSLIERIEQRAEKNKVTRTDAVIEALVAGLGSKSEGIDTKLLTAIEALRSEVRALAG